MTPATARPIADVYACIRALSDAAVSLSLHVYRRIGAGERERVDNRTADLLRRPSPAPTQANLIGQLVAHLNVAGNAYLGKFRNSQGAVDQLAHDEVVHVHVKPGETVIVTASPTGTAPRSRSPGTSPMSSRPRSMWSTRTQCPMWRSAVTLREAKPV